MFDMFSVFENQTDIATAQTLEHCKQTIIYLS